MRYVAKFLWNLLERSPDSPKSSTTEYPYNKKYIKEHEYFKQLLQLYYESTVVVK